MLSSSTDLAGVAILLVDDDPTFREFVGAGLSEHGVTCHAVADGQAALTSLTALASDRRSPDVVLLDIMMPGLSGWDVLQEIRRQNLEVPVIFVTAREAVDERVRGLRMGADDYIIKPFAFVELLARIESVIRRRRATVISYGNLQIQSIERVCLVSNRPVDLTPREFEVLWTLVASDGAVSRARLLERVWRTDVDPGTNIVEVHVARLRRKLHAARGPSILTERGKGYFMGGPR